MDASELRDEAEAIAAVGKTPREALWSPRLSRDVDFGGYGSLAFEALLGLVDTCSPEQAEKLLPILEKALQDWPLSSRAEVARPGTLGPLMDTTGWGLIRELGLLFPDRTTVQYLARRPEASTLRVLHLVVGEIDESLLRPLIESPYLENFESLYLPSTLDSALTSMLASWSAMPRLRHVLFWGDTTSLFRTAQLSRLESLDATANSLFLRDIDEILSAPLRKLALYSPEEEQGLAGLADAPNICRGLRALRLSGMDRGDQMAAELAECRALTGLESLTMQQVGLTARGIEALGRCEFLSNLVHLDLASNPIRDQGWAMISDWPLERLETLNLSATQCTDFSAQRLVPRSSIRHLKSLDVSENAIGHMGARSLATWPAVETLEHLNFRFCPVGTDGAVSLAESPYLSNLRHLTIDHVGARAVVALAQSPYLKALEALDVGLLSDTGDAISVLGESELMANLLNLCLSAGDLSDDDLRRLTASSRTRHLRVLDLGLLPHITDRGIEALAAWPGLQGLWHLELAGILLGDEGVRAFAESPHLQSLVSLKLIGLQITLEGSRLLADAGNLPRLRSFGMLPELAGPWTTSANVSPLLRARMQRLKEHAG